MRKPESNKGNKGSNKKRKGQKPISEKKKKILEFKEKQRKRKGDPLPKLNREDIRLNKFLSNAGICSRREADVLIESGVVEVNDKVVTELGVKVKPGDVVKYDGQTINPDTKRYVLLNKPKDFVTNMYDPKGRKTALSLVRKACKERIAPIDKMDRSTTGLLLFTNDGDLAKKLNHPSSSISKLYHVVTDHPVKQAHIHQLTEGLELEDGLIRAMSCDYVSDSKENNEVGIEIISGKNRVVRRMFEALGYKVIKLDRVVFAGLTKKELPRGEWRHLSKKELDFLRML